MNPKTDLPKFSLENSTDTVHDRTLQYMTVQYRTKQFRTVQYSIAQIIKVFLKIEQKYSSLPKINFTLYNILLPKAYLPIYLPTCHLPTYLPIYLPTCHPPTYLPSTYLLTIYLPTCHLPTYLPINLPTSHLPT